MLGILKLVLGLWFLFFSFTKDIKWRRLLDGALVAEVEKGGAGFICYRHREKQNVDLK